MSPSQATTGREGDAKQKKGTSAGGENYAVHNHDHNRPHVADRTITSVLDEVRQLRSENESLHGDVDTLKGDVDSLKIDVMVLLKRQEDSPDISVATTAPASCDRATDEKPNTNPPAVTGIAAKKRMKKKNKKRGDKVTKYCGCAGEILRKIAAGTSSLKIAAYLTSIALLVSIAFGQGIIGRTAPIISDQQHDQHPPKFSKPVKPVDSATKMSNEVVSPAKVSLPGDQANQEVPVQIKQTIGQTIDFHKQIVVAESSNIRNEDSSSAKVSAGQTSEGINGKSSLVSESKESSLPHKFHQFDSIASAKTSDARITTQDRNLYNVIDSTATSIDGEEVPTSETTKTMSSLRQSRRKFKNITKRRDHFTKMKSGKEEPPTEIPVLGGKGTLSRSFQANSSPPTNSLIAFSMDSVSAPASAPQENSPGTLRNLAYVCDSDPETCGCPTLWGADYRGSINTTANGLPCIKWSEDILQVPPFNISQQFPDDGLTENFCRNPWYDDGGPLCFIRTGSDDVDFGYCDVPACQARTASPTASAVPSSSTGPTGSPSSSSLPSSSSSPTQSCPVADNEVCGCEAVQQSDYRGTISTTNDDFVCERWDSELGDALKLVGVDIFGDYPNAGLDENFCRNPGKDKNGPFCIIPGLHQPDRGYCDIPKCDPCACTPQCGEPNQESCGCPSFRQADTCCNEEDSMCKCRYLRDACRISLENNSTDFCDDAEDSCCNGKGGESNTYCKCNMYEQICSESPSQYTCDFAASSCCESEHDGTGSNDRCLCDFYTYSAINFESLLEPVTCASAIVTETNSISPPSFEKRMVVRLYYFLGGENWFDDTGWLDDTIPHCQWFGLECDDEDYLVEINMRNNNLIGIAEDLFGGYPFIDYVLSFHRLTKIDVAGNQLTGKLRSVDINRHRRLVYIDISENNFIGHVDMTFPPTTVHANYSHNNFVSVSFKRSNPAYETIQVVDLSNNRIDQYASEMFPNIPHNIEELILSNNQLKGTLPDPFPLENARRFVIANNAINGDLPYFPTPLLKELDLSNQNQQENGGLTGTVRDDHLEELEGIHLLNLAGNYLSGDIPSSLGIKQYLQVLNLSSNALDKSIPTELGRLKDVLEVLDLSTNELTGTIPLELANPDGALVRLHLSGNDISPNPVPLHLCFLPEFDLVNDAELCPPERNALKSFYDSAKGSEWTESKSWLDPIIRHCEWYGVSCSDQSNYVIKLELRNNGLSGKLSEEIAALTSLEVLDLSDNGIKGAIPTAIGTLTNLKYLRLCYNEFIGNHTNFENLPHLELVQIHGNRLSGTIRSPNMLILGPSSFVSDCGNPSDFGESLVCDGCSMCCNVQGDCFSTEDNPIQKAGIKNYLWFSLVFIACLFAASGALALVVYVHDKHQHRNLPRSSISQPAFIDRDEKYALGTIGDNSVYQFFLGKSLSGWIVVLLALSAQVWLLFIFVAGAEIDWTNDSSALVYTWKCPRDEDECVDKSDLDLTGWFAFTILMAAHLLKDIINGTKLVLLSGKERHDRYTRMRFFIGGTLLTTVAAFTFYVSAIYNAAIATDNREIIENSVIILFICDIDELLFDILMAADQDWANEGWIDEMSGEVNQEEEPAIETGTRERDDEEDGMIRDLQHHANEIDASGNQFEDDKHLVGKVQHLTEVVETLQETVKEQKEQLKIFLTTPPGDHAYEQFLQKLNDM